MENLIESILSTPNNIQSNIEDRLDEIEAYFSTENSITSFSTANSNKKRKLGYFALQVGMYYAQCGDSPKVEPYLRILEQFIDPDSNPEFTADIFILKALCMQQQAESLNKNKQYQEAARRTIETEEICRNILFDYPRYGISNNNSSALAYYILALINFEQSRNSPLKNTTHSVGLACAYCEKSLQLYQQSSIETGDMMFLCIKSCYAQLLVWDEQFFKALAIFRELMDCLDRYPKITHPYFSNISFIYAKFLFNLYGNSGYRDKVYLDQAKDLIQKIVKKSENNSQNQSILNEAKQLGLEIGLELALNQILYRGNRSETTFFNQPKSNLEPMQRIYDIRPDTLTIENSENLINSIVKLKINLFYENNSISFDSLKLIASIFYFLGRFAISERCLQFALTAYALKKMNNKGELIELYHMLFSTYIYLGEYDKAYEVHAKLPNSQNDNLDDILISCNVLYILGPNFNLDQKLSALENVVKAINNFQTNKPDLYFKIAECNILCAHFYLEQAAEKKSDLLNKAEIYLTNALKIYNQHFPDHVNLIRLYNKLGCFSLLKDEVQSAKRYFTAALKFANKMTFSNHHTLETYLGLSQISKPKSYIKKYYSLAYVLRIENAINLEKEFEVLVSGSGYNMNESAASVQPRP